MSADHVIVESTTDSEAAAEELAAGAVKAGLAACGQVVGPIMSVFYWDAEVRTESEWRMQLKTAADRAEALVEYIRRRHTYELPEVVVMPIVGGSDRYLSWLVTETRDGER